MTAPDGDVTRLLGELREGNRGAADQLIPLVHRELRRMAGAYMQRERPGHTLQATALVNEAYLRLVGGEPGPWQNRAHFFAVAAHTMRQVLTDHARRRCADKRGGSDVRKVDLDEGLLVADDKLEVIIAVHEALERLALIDPRQSRIVELRFFVGLNVEETAEAMGISEITVKRDWRLAKAWLGRELGADFTGASSQ